MEEKLRGQWIGPFNGYSEGVVVLELDRVGVQSEGAIYAWFNQANLPAVAILVKIPTDKSEFDLELIAEPIHDGQIVRWDDIKDKYPGITFEPKIKTKWKIKDDIISVEWESAHGPGRAELSKSNAERSSQLTPDVKIQSWNQFKDYAISLEPQRYVFRGQADSNWRLRTHFHRAGRFSLIKLIGIDIPQLHGHLSNLTQHHFRLVDPLENAAFYSLVQHHGYPTPLLDWTHSPFIAAFFAYRGLKTQSDLGDRKVRIFVFDQREWQINNIRSQLICPARPHFSFLNPLAINNPRMVPQQALSTITNVDDIEHFIGFHERRVGKRFVQVIDLPAADRNQIMHELSLMGITAGSMFPGLDGACEQLKERNFGSATV
jgi:hypothetical protein